MEQLRIDEEFQKILPPLTEEEFQQLEKNIVNDNEVRDPIIVWNGVIVDGHNRWNILQKHPDIPYQIKRKDFKDRWQVIDWIISTQSGRRNLTELKRTDLMGLQLEARKHTEKFFGNQYVNSKGVRKNCADQTDSEAHNKCSRTTNEIAKEFGVAPRTVDDAYAFHKGMEVVEKEDKQLASDILNGKTRVTKKEIMELRKAEPEELKKSINQIKEGIKRPRKNPKMITEKDRQDMKQIAKYVDDMQSSKTCEPTLDDLLKDLRNNSTPYIRLLNSMIKGYASVIKGNHEKVIETIDECIVKEINNLKEVIINEYA